MTAMRSDCATTSKRARVTIGKETLLIKALEPIRHTGNGNIREPREFEWIHRIATPRLNSDTNGRLSSAKRSRICAKRARLSRSPVTRSGAAMKLPPSLSTGDPSYFVAASTSGSASPTVLTMSKASAAVCFVGVVFIEAESAPSRAVIQPTLRPDGMKELDITTRAQQDSQLYIATYA